MSRRIDRVLVADRGEAAFGVARRLEAAGLEAVVVYTDSEADQPWLDEVAFAARIAEEPGTDAYRDNLKLVSAALDAGCDAVHPGTGAGARDPELAHMVMNVGLAWVGATPQALSACEDRAGLRRAIKELALPVVAQTAALNSVGDARTWVEKWRPPLRVVRGRGPAVVISEPADLERAIGGDPVPFHLERHVLGARHLCFAVMGDGGGAALSLGVHERTVRHDERVRLREAPVFGLAPEIEDKMADAVRRVASALGLVGVGAVEVLLGADGRWWIHDVVPSLFEGYALHEEVYGLELVHAQVRLAAGETLGWTQDEIRPAGAAVEVTIEASESGTVTGLELPEGASTACAEGMRVEITRDPLLARLLVTAPMRHAALVRTRAALEEVRVEGLRHDTPRMLELLGDPRAWAGAMAEGLLDDDGG